MHNKGGDEQGKQFDPSNANITRIQLSSSYACAQAIIVSINHLLLLFVNKLNYNNNEVMEYKNNIKYIFYIVQINFLLCKLNKLRNYCKECNWYTFLWY